MKKKWVSVMIFVLVIYLAIAILKKSRTVHRVHKSIVKKQMYPQCSQQILKPNTDINIPTDEKEWKSLEYLRANLEPGGSFKPKGCNRNERIAIIVSYRNRESNLKVFLQHMHPFLQRQKRYYRIFVVEMQGNTAFNRGSSMNVGFVEAIKQGDYNCFIFHDVDLLPLRDEHQYTCGPQPIHLSSGIDAYNYSEPYPAFFGGIVAFTKKQYAKINGFANVYKGWGREDDDLELRTRRAGYTITRPSNSIARYQSLGHKKAKIKKINYKLFKRASKRRHKDGLNNLNYTVHKIELRPLYTWINVEVAA